MTPHPAFVLGAPTSAFTSNPLRCTKTSPIRRTVAARPSSIRMQQKRGLFNNPFSRDSEQPPTTFAEPQPGDPGAKTPEPVPKGTGMTSSESKPGAKKLPVVEGVASVAKRGLALLQEDLLRNAPEKAGVGRQDRNVVMKPLAGEPGYKPAAYQTVKVSSLGISPFTDDANYVSKVGGVDAVVKAAQEVKKGATAKELKKKFLMEEARLKPKAPEVVDIPDYLKPLPEDTPRKGMSWKNYVGR